MSARDQAPSASDLADPYSRPRTTGTAAAEHQHSLAQILTIWALAAIPMALLAWVATPAVGDRLDLDVGDENREAFTRAMFIALALVMGWA